MEITARVESRRNPMAHTAQNDRSGRHSNLRLRKRSSANAGNHAAGKDRHFASQAILGSKLAGLRKNLHSWQRESGARTANIDNGSAQEHRPLRALPPLA